MYLAKLFGKYATLGLAEDTWSLNEGILDEKAFLEQAYMIHEERETQFFDALNKTKKGLCAVVIDASDRIQHMFFRTLDDDHPANKRNNHAKHKNVIEDLYTRMDDLVGREPEHPEGVLAVDHEIAVDVAARQFADNRRGRGKEQRYR